ncbi:hypothetical protein, partial [Microbispora sp. CSR-4]|uniref:hypothetical protein n=1 Tax=Microbispora sp. CSR-4 TaxID=2592813 RepID=UPI001650B820
TANCPSAYDPAGSRPRRRGGAWRPAAALAIFLGKNYSIKLGPIYYKNSHKTLHPVWGDRESGG